MKLLVVVDIQNDFIDAALGTKEAVAIVPAVQKKIEEYRKVCNPVVFTRDTHHMLQDLQVLRRLNLLASV
nr:isochorismatase family protein [uncultured Treponema sp.]